MSSPTTFFRRLFGFAEMDYVNTKKELLNVCKFERKGDKERCLFRHPQVSGGTISSGWHSTPSVQELRDEVGEAVKRFNQRYPGTLAALRKRWQRGSGSGEDTSSRAVLSCEHIVGDAGELHRRHPNALFQAASQFNLLEFISEDVVPEDGVTHYVFDRTQGPACALACMAGTAYRNYLIHPSLFHDANRQTHEDACNEMSAAKELEEVDPTLRGQCKSHQVNTLLGVERCLSKLSGADAAPFPYFQIRNGYFSPLGGLQNLSRHLKAVAEAQSPDSTTTAMLALCDKCITSPLRIGLVEDATVTTPLYSSSNSGELSLHTVSQVYCSALSLSHFIASRSGAEAEPVTLLASSVLNGAYEGTLLFAVLRSLGSLEHQLLEGSGSVETLSLPPVFLTKVGGGVFNNKASWIKKAIEHALESVSDFGVPLDVALVHFNSVDPAYQ